MYISQDIRIISLELLPCFKTNGMLVKSELYMYDPLMHNAIYYDIHPDGMI